MGENRQLQIVPYSNENFLFLFVSSKLIQCQSILLFKITFWVGPVLCGSTTIASHAILTNITEQFGLNLGNQSNFSRFYILYPVLHWNPNDFVLEIYNLYCALINKNACSFYASLYFKKLKTLRLACLLRKSLSLFFWK